MHFYQYNVEIQYFDVNLVFWQLYTDKACRK